jgi:hypothetical protein
LINSASFSIACGRLNASVMVNLQNMGCNSPYKASHCAIAFVRNESSGMTAAQADCTKGVGRRRIRAAKPVDNLRKWKEVCMVSPVPGNPSDNEQTGTAASPSNLRKSARYTGQTLRTYSFEVIAFLLGIALAFM